MKIFHVTQNTNLKDFTDAVYPQGSFCFAALARAKDIKVNGARVNKNVPLAAGDTVAYYTTAKQEAMPSHNTVYEDKNVYVADKFSGVSSEALLTELNSRGAFYAVHRLDRNTQGLIIFAKTPAAEEELTRAFRERRVKKIYYAVCKNAFGRDGEILTAYLLKDGGGTVKIYDRAVAGAVKIVTQYRVLNRYGDIALVEIILHTGKTHQIRAHAAHIGCPVLGDGKYGDGALNAKYSLARQQLTAKFLSFDLEGELSYLNCEKFESGLENYSALFRTS